MLCPFAFSVRLQLSLKVKAPRCDFATLETIYITTQRDILEDLNFQLSKS